jgi:ribosomal protein S18 acetylase RimI-like enzyme
LTVREYRKGDWAGIAELWRRNPSEEFPLLGVDPDTMADVLHRTERLKVRFVLGVFRALGRPIFVELIVEIEGRVLGASTVSFTAEAAYVSEVVVDSSVRRRGHAREMLGRCNDLARKYHRGHVVLDVLSQNAPALALYHGLGYQSLRDQAWLARTFVSDAPLPSPSGTTRIRPFDRNDGESLARIANAAMSPDVRRILPRHSGDFQVSGAVLRFLHSETEAWVAEVNGQPAGFLRATAGQLTQAAHLTSPVLRPDVPEFVARDLFLTALRWIESRRPPRVLMEVPDHHWQMLPLLTSLGFVEQWRMRTLVLALGA